MVLKNTIRWDLSPLIYPNVYLYLCKIVSSISRSFHKSVGKGDIYTWIRAKLNITLFKEVGRAHIWSREGGWDKAYGKGFREETLWWGLKHHHLRQLISISLASASSCLPPSSLAPSLTPFAINLLVAATVVI